MFELSIGRFAPNIASLLLTRGTGLPPLQWQSQPHRGAKKALDESDEAKLFARDGFVSEPMAAGVRAMLYLWNGWPGDCSMYGQLAESKERLYLMGLCDRLLGNWDSAKKVFQQLDGHSLYAALGADALEMIGSKPQPALKRFREIIELNATWEPYAFIDLFNQAVGGGLDAVTEEVVRQLQCREFERLFSHCYQAATGEAITVRPAGADNAPRKVPPKPRPAARRTKGSAPSAPRAEDGQAKKADKSPGAVQSPSSLARVVCPKCTHIGVFPTTLLGKAVKCPKCQGFFEIPRAAAAASRP